MASNFKKELCLICTILDNESHQVIDSYKFTKRVDYPFEFFPGLMVKDNSMVATKDCTPVKKVDRVSADLDRKKVTAFLEIERFYSDEIDGKRLRRWAVKNKWELKVLKEGEIWPKN